MRKLATALHTKLPDGCGWLVRLLGALVVALAILGVIGPLQTKWEVWIRKRDAVAIVNGTTNITRSELRERLEALLWRSGASWTDLSAEERKRLREDAVNALIAERLVKRESAVNTSAMPRESREAFQQFLKQFEGDEWKQRAEWQGLSEVSLRQRISDETVMTDALEKELARRGPPVTEDDLHRWYYSHRDKLVNPERVHASHIFLTRHDTKNPDRAKEVAEIHRKLLAHEATFEELAAKYSDDERSKRIGGDLGWLSRAHIPQDFGDKVFALPVGQVSEVFETSLGWHIARVKEKRSAEPLTFEQAKPEIEALLMDERRHKALTAFLSELRQAAHIERFEDRIAAVDPAP